VTRLSRRTLLGMAPLALGSCGGEGRYFGNLTPPPTQTLVYEIGSEPSGFDPATCLGISEAYIWPALVETLVSTDPDTLEPTAGLATHYETDAKQTEFKFFLRGHSHPRGAKLPGDHGPGTAAMWSDGRPVTGVDFVCAWRRLVDPVNASVNAYFAGLVANAKDILAGKARPETLGISAPDELTVAITLESAAPHFLKMAANLCLAAAPRHAIQQQRASWTTPGRMVSCGPFVLAEWRPYDRVVVRRNPRYYGAPHVHLQAIEFVPVVDGSTSVNLYRAGTAYAMHGRAVPPLWIPALRRHRDFHTAPAYRNMFYAFNTRRTPFDDVLVRYAFHMATDKQQITRFLEGGQTPARTLIPPFGGYEPVATLPVEAGGRVWDVLSYNPEAARELLRLAGCGALDVTLTIPNRVKSKEIAEIIQKQWAVNLGARVSLTAMDWNIWVQTLQLGAYKGVTECGFGADWPDPTSFLELFNGRDDGSGWTDPRFRTMVARASAETDPATRMRSLAECEAYMLRAMPLLPLFFDTYSYLQKPYVKGMTPNILDVPNFKGVRIDTNWRAA
jgi:oligopeptide transport system substrate-binding protein